MSNWIQTWTACFESISAPRAEAIESYVSEKCQGLQPGEFERTVSLLAENWNPREQGKVPGIGLIIATIRNARKTARGIDTSEPYEVTMARRSMRTLISDGLDRWNAVCKVHEAFGVDMTNRVIKAAIDNGGFTLPWWAPATIPHTRQLPRPPGVTSSADLLAHNKRMVYDGGRNDDTDDQKGVKEKIWKQVKR